MNARTQNEMFAEFKKTHSGDGKSWRQYWLERWKDAIGMYIWRGWQLIPLGNRNKRPTGKWTDERLTISEAIAHVEKGGNLGVVANDDLVILDYDSHDLPDIYLSKTLTCLSPRGFLFFTEPPYDGRSFAALKRKFINFDTPRVDIMYALVPLSVTCLHENDRNHVCTRHDYRVREWLDLNRPPIPFKEFCGCLSKKN